MSDPPDYTTIPIFGGTVREVRGLLADEGALQQATQALLTAGFDRGDLSLPQSEPDPADPSRTETPADQHDLRQARTTVNSTIGIAGALVGGTIASVATGGAMLPVAAAAVASAAGAGGLAHLGVQSSADDREAAHDARGIRGTLTLATVVRDAHHEALAQQVLRDAGATKIEAVERHGGDARTA